MRACLSGRFAAALGLDRARPGEVQGGVGFSPDSLLLAFSLTFDFHLPRFLSTSKNKLRMVEETVNDVHVAFHAIIDHFLFAVLAEDDQHRSLTCLRVMADLNERFLAVVKYPDWFEPFVFPFDLIVETQRIQCVATEFRYGIVMLLLFLLRRLVMPNRALSGVIGIANATRAT